SLEVDRAAAGLHGEVISIASTSVEGDPICSLRSPPWSVSTRAPPHRRPPLSAHLDALQLPLPFNPAKARLPQARAAENGKERAAFRGHQYRLILASGTCMFAERVFKIHKGPGKAAHAGLLTHVRAGKRLYTYSCRRRHSAGAYCAPRCAAYRLGPRTCRDFRRYTARAGIELQSYRATVCPPGGGDAMPLHYT